MNDEGGGGRKVSTEMPPKMYFLFAIVMYFSVHYV